MLSTTQISEFRENGFVVIDEAFTQSELEPFRRDFNTWVEESRQHTGPFGQMLDGRQRFDVEPGHSAEQPGLRRIAAPEEISDNYLSLVKKGPLIDAVVSLLGNDVRFHHAKVNSKLPGTGTTVKWHQDFTFDPHSNDDCITTMLFLDDVTSENGAPRMVPGSHRGPLYSLWHNGVFTGAIDDSIVRECEQKAVECTGKAGSLCLMHTRTLHGSSINSTDSPRTLYITNLTSADAMPLAAIAVPSIHTGMIVHGQEPGRIRSIDYEIEMPEVPEGTSFFAQQANDVKVR
jgi:ectoine hydroxylase-related dioxygenase (phytanoyl-CoA dioxygenase family)